MANSHPFSLFGLDPLFSCNVKVLSAIVINRITCHEREGFYEFRICGRPISKVELVGIVVRKAVKSRKVILQIDDGTGLIECLKFYDSDYAVPLQHIQIGELVSVKGFLTKSYDELVIHINAINVLHDPNLEVQHRITSMYLYKTEYSKAGPTDKISSELTEVLPALQCPPITCKCNISTDIKVRLLCCECNLTPCADPVTAMFRFQLLDFLLRQEDCFVQSIEKPFTTTFGFLIHNTEIIDLITKLIQTIFQTDITSSCVGSSTSTLSTRGLRDVSLRKGEDLTHTIANVLRKVCASLSKDGVFVLSEPVTDTYMLMSLTRVLKPAVKGYFEELGLTNTDGISSGYSKGLVDAVVSAARLGTLAMVPRWRVETVARSILDDFGPRVLHWADTNNH